MINFASNLNKMIDAGLGGPLDPPRTEVAVGHRVVYTEASGAVVNFESNMIAPVKNLRVTMEPIQDLNGQSNPYPAGGGKNLLDPNLLVTKASWNMLEVPLTPGTYTMSTNVTAEESSELAMYFRKNASDTQGSTTLVTSTHPVTRVIEEGDTPVLSFRRVSGTKVFTDYEWQIESGSSATAYAPYENICPITGRESVTVTRTGINVWDEELEEGSYKINGKAWGPTYWRAVHPVKVIPGQTYFVSAPTMTIYLYGYDMDMGNGRSLSAVGRVLNVPDGIYNIGFFFLKSAYGITYNHDISVNYPSTDHDYHAYDGQSATIQLGDTVYGGTVDVTTGMMTVEWENIVSYDGEALPGEWISDRDAYAPGTTPTTGAQVCYKLATPLTIQLTPTQLTTLKGQNNVWSDADSVTLEYPYYEETEGY